MITVMKSLFYYRKKERGIHAMGNFIVGLVLVGIVTLIIRNMLKDKKNGKSLQCGGDCSHCGGGHCH